MNNTHASFPDDYIDLTPEKWKLLNEFTPPKEVCHYTKMDTALMHILGEKKILLGNLSETNDPKESKNRLVRFISKPKTKYDVSGLIYGFGRVRSIKVFCTCCHNNPAWEITNQKHLDNAHLYGVGRSTLWAHYANRYKGVCIIFDGEALHKNIHNKVLENGGNPEKDIQRGFVMYDFIKAFTETRGNNDDPHSLMEHYDLNFLSKTPEWRSEHEFRWLVIGEQKSKLLVSIENAIKAVIVSAEDFSMACLPILECMCKESNIRLGQISWTNGLSEVRFMTPPLS